MLGIERFAGNLSVDFDDDVSQWGLDGMSSLSSVTPNLLSHTGKSKFWKDLCEPYPSYNDQTGYLVRKQVQGPEDPKLITLPQSGWGLTFSSYPPASLLVHDSSAEECMWHENAVMQMYLAAHGENLVSDGGTALGVHLQCGSPTDDEKNFIAFAHEDGELYFIYTVEPHVIVHARQADGACARQYVTSSPDLASELAVGNDVRGSATALRYSEDEYLAILHVHNTGGYTTMAYTFEAQPPFAVKRISKPLPLQGGKRAFASSLVLRDGKVLIGYGEADEVARVLVMSRNYLENQFDWCDSSS